MYSPSPGWNVPLAGGSTSRRSRIGTAFVSPTRSRTRARSPRRDRLASATLREWADADEQVVVCVRSLTTILQYADDAPALAFLRELLDHCERADALVHVHLDPTAVDERTVEGVRGQVDAVVELTPE